MGQYGPEESFRMDETVRDEMSAPLTPIVVDLGPENEGEFGPRPGEDPNEFVSRVAGPEYKRRPSGVWVCVDGREDVAGYVDDGETADDQVPGSLPITNTAGDMMDDTLDSPRLSERVAENTREAVEDGHEVIVHGDDHAGKDGCAANAKMRPTLAKIAANADIIGPRVWAFCQVAGIDDEVTPDDITRSMVTAGQRAKDNSAWDATPAQVVDIAVANGARYQVLKGPHRERAVAATLSGAYASQKFAQDHTTPGGDRYEVFGLSVGDYVQTTIVDTLNRGGTRREGALKAMRGLVYSTGLCKKIGNPNLRVIALQEAI